MVDRPNGQHSSSSSPCSIPCTSSTGPADWAGSPPATCRVMTHAGDSACRPRPVSTDVYCAGSGGIYALPLSFFVIAPACGHWWPVPPLADGTPVRYSFLIMGPFFLSFGVFVLHGAVETRWHGTSGGVAFCGWSSSVAAVVVLVPAFRMGPRRGRSGAGALHVSTSIRRLLATGDIDSAPPSGSLLPSRPSSGPIMLIPVVILAGRRRVNGSAFWAQLRAPCQPDSPSCSSGSISSKPSTAFTSPATPGDRRPPAIPGSTGQSAREPVFSSQSDHSRVARRRLWPGVGATAWRPIELLATAGARPDDPSPDRGGQLLLLLVARTSPDLLALVIAVGSPFAHQAPRLGSSEYWPLLWTSLPRAQLCHRPAVVGGEA